jgi:hypothetical protein
MADPITFRPTSEDTENLAILTADGTSPSRAIRHALQIAAHRKRQEDLRADAGRLTANPEYQAEIRAIREELDELRYSQRGQPNMDPFVATIIKQAAVLGLAAGVLVALVYGLSQYSKLQYALTLTITPPQVA